MLDETQILKLNCVALINPLDNKSKAYSAGHSINQSVLPKF